MTRDEIQKRVEKLTEHGMWNCEYTFPYGIKTSTNPSHINSPGFNLNKWPRLKSILDDIGLDNKTIVDIGCGDGYYVIEAAKAGAKFCLGTDIDELRIKRGLLAKELLEVDNVDFKAVDLYKDTLDKFDIVMGLGLLHRVPDIDKCIEKLASIGKYILLEFKTLDNPEPIKKNHGGKTKSNIYNGLWSTPTQSYIVTKMASFGFSNYKIYEDTKSGLNYKRTVMLFENEEI
jgi:cyclopropane fatty-acyl-phospholipid synthase-like methyltransferase